MLLLCLHHNIGRTAESTQSTDAFLIETSGYFSLRSVEDEGNGSSANRSGALAVLKSRLRYDGDLLALQLHPALVRSTGTGGDETTVHVDELYWERQLSPLSFTFLGRRRIVNGVAIGRNPTDFLNQDKTADNTLTDEDRRAEKEGDYMVGWSYFGQGYSIQSLVAAPAAESKRVRALLQISSNWNALSTDFSFIAYYADRPALGVNLSTVLGEKMTAYAEAALRKGRDRQRPLLSPSRVVVGAMDDADRWIADIVVGGQYTTEVGLTFAVEYWRNNNGFSDVEYNGIVSSLTSGQGDLALAKGLIRTAGMRKESTFFRVSEIRLAEAVKGELMWISNLEDHSNFLRGAINWDFSKTDAFRIGIDKFSGSQLSEYGAGDTDRRIFLIYKKFF